MVTCVNNIIIVRLFTGATSLQKESWYQHSSTENIMLQSIDPCYDAEDVYGGNT